MTKNKILTNQTDDFCCVTLPAEKNAGSMVLELARRWQADAIRDSDGTELASELLNSGFDIYSTLCLVRADQKWVREHPEHMPQQYLISDYETAYDSMLQIDILKKYCRLKYAVNPQEPGRYWEVINRTTGEVLSVDDWEYDHNSGLVYIKNTTPFNIYTVNFLAFEIWESVSMYNHVTNGWTGEKIIGVNPMHPEAYSHLMEYFDQWLEDHPRTDVVRLTTLAYNFVLINGSDSRQIFSDWRGYAQSVSPLALDEFEKVKGYRLCSEDFVDEGYYNAIYRNPSKRYLDWMDFIQDFVVKFGRDLVDRIHKKGKRAAIFWGDHWAGVEPYTSKYQQMNSDIDIGACESGVSLRRLADIDKSQAREIRLFPYFFPDTFYEGGNPTGESMARWVKIRRAFMRNPVDRIGWGGYLSLAVKFPDFVSHIETIAQEFKRHIVNTDKSKPVSSQIKVALLSSWGKIRAWMPHVSPSHRFNAESKDTLLNTVNSHVLECLAGLPIEVDFVSFDDLRKNGIPEDVDIIINDGYAGTSWSGGANWLDSDIVAAIRKWVFNGGAFLGFNAPGAYGSQGRFFQLSDILGVDMEAGNTIGYTVNNPQIVRNHFILQDKFADINFGTKQSFVYALNEQVKVLAGNENHILMGVNNYGQGRSAYMAGLPFNFENCRLLIRTLFWLSNKENELRYWIADDLNIEYAVYPQNNIIAAANNSGKDVETEIVISPSQNYILELQPYEMCWIDIQNK
jgi:1,3-beta-galactosyl-N-acetylhexosamine phosphorylase